MDYQARIQDAQNALNTSTAQANDAQNNLTNFQGSMKGANDFYNEAQTQFGVQGAQDTANKSKQALGLTQGLINNLPNSVTGRTQGSLVTEAQRQKLLQNEMTPLNNQYNIQGQNYNDQQSALQSLMEQASGQSSRNYQGQQDKYSTLNDLFKTLLGQKNQAQSDLGSWTSQLQAYQQAQEQIRQFNETAAFNRQKAAQDYAAATAGINLSRQQSDQSRADAQRQQALSNAAQKAANVKAANAAASKANAAVSSQPRDFYNSLNPWEQFVQSTIGGVQKNFLGGSAGSGGW
jgi:chromosome segregation ATPase